MSVLTIYVVDNMKVSNQSQSFDFRVKAAVSQENEQITLVARHPRDELPYICQYTGEPYKRFQPGS